MKAIFEEPFGENAFQVNLPFNKITSRAVIVRRRDGALLGVLHRKNGKYAPPGGQMEDEETPDQTVIRELEEENIRLIDPDDYWRNRLAVDHHGGDGSLNLWYIFLVEDVQVGQSEEIIEVRWLDQGVDVWYPGMREKICLAIQEAAPDMLRVNVSVLESW